MLGVSQRYYHNWYSAVSELTITLEKFKQLCELLQFQDRKVFASYSQLMNIKYYINLCRAWYVTISILEFAISSLKCPRIFLIKLCGHSVFWLRKVKVKKSNIFCNMKWYFIDQIFERSQSSYILVSYK